MSAFSYFTPTRVVFGENTEKQAGGLVRAFGGSRVLIVYGSERVRKTGLMDIVEASLAAEQIPFTSIGGVVPNPRLSLVYEAIAKARDFSCDFILAVGGGSVIDTAKAVGYGLCNPGDPWDFYIGKRKPDACMPVGVVLTIAAAGSEMSNSSVITNEETGEKMGANYDVSRPKFAIMDPALTVTTPDWQTESGCADIMMHTMERYFTSGDKMEITDELAEGLLRTVMQMAKILHHDPQNVAARGEVMWASSLSHNGLTGCGNTKDDFVCHKMEHELGAMFDVTHGAGLAALWPTWARYVAPHCLSRFVRFALRVMGVSAGDTDAETAERGICAMEAFYREIGMPIRIRELGITPTEEQMKEMAHHLAVSTGGHFGSARVLREEDFLAIYRQAL